MASASDGVVVRHRRAERPGEVDALGAFSARRRIEPWRVQARPFVVVAPAAASENAFAGYFGRDLAAAALISRCQR
jgi:hypothetical protein